MRPLAGRINRISIEKDRVDLSTTPAPPAPEAAACLAETLHRIRCARERGKPIRNHHILVVDLAQSSWDWTKGEPPEHDPAYYPRYNKTFSRMGGTMRYLRMDNRDFLLQLHHSME